MCKRLHLIASYIVWQQFMLRWNQIKNSMQFYPSVLALAQPQNLCHTHTEIHFLKIMKSCSEPSKTNKSVKNWKSKILMSSVFSSITYIRK